MDADEDSVTGSAGRGGQQRRAEQSAFEPGRGDDRRKREPRRSAAASPTRHVDTHVVTVDWGDGTAATTLESGRRYPPLHDACPPVPKQPARPTSPIHHRHVTDATGQRSGGTTVTVHNVAPASAVEPDGRNGSRKRYDDAQRQPSPIPHAGHAHRHRRLGRWHRGHHAESGPPVPLFHDAGPPVLNNRRPARPIPSAVTVADVDGASVTGGNRSDAFQNIARPACS